MMRVVRQIVEKLCVIITIILVYENALVFYQHLFPYWWTHGYYFKFFFHIILGHWLLINTVKHYYLGIVISPGFVADLNNELSTKEELSYKKCLKCGVIRPPRAHHCKVCRKCVLRYDHHCK
jgi:palmitoyltransferase